MAQWLSCKALCLARLGRKRVSFMSDPFWLLKPPYGFFTFGMFLIFLGLVQTYMGKSWVRGGGWVYRAKEPKRYWSNVATCYLGGVFLIGIFLYEVHAFSN